MKKANYLRRSAAALTAAVLAVASLPVLAASSAEYNTWTGYVLRDAAGRYLSVSGGTEGEGVQVGFYEADGVAPYNTWYFTETNLGVTIKSALSQGEYYLTENFRENRLELSTSAGTFELGEDGYLRGFRSGVESPIYAQVTPQPVTNLHMGDWNSDGVVDGLDLSQLRKAVQEIGADVDFAQQAVGDTNGDGVLDGTDVQRLQQYLLGENVAMAEVRIPECSMVPAWDPPVRTHHNRNHPGHYGNDDHHRHHNYGSAPAGSHHGGLSQRLYRCGRLDLEQPDCCREIHRAPEHHLRPD